MGPESAGLGARPGNGNRDTGYTALGKNELCEAEPHPSAAPEPSRRPLGARPAKTAPLGSSIVSNSNGIDVVTRQCDCGQGSRLGITVLWPPRQLLKGNAPALDSSAPRLRCAEADEIHWAVSASLGTLEMIGADYQFDVNSA